MKGDRVIEIPDAAEVGKNIEERVRNVGVKNLDFAQAQEWGIFQRMSNILTVMHTTIMAAYMVYGEFDYLADIMHAKKNEVKREMNIFEKAIDRFFAYWTSFYKDKSVKKTVALQAEMLSKQLMKWMQVPERWKFGEPQQTDEPYDVGIRIVNGEEIYTFNAASLDVEPIACEETWGVLKYDPLANKQMSVCDNMDKASALMVAKRMSDEDKEHYYTAAVIREITEKRVDVVPLKVFKANEIAGSITKTLKD